MSINRDLNEGSFSLINIRRASNRLSFYRDSELRLSLARYLIRNIDYVHYLYRSQEERLRDNECPTVRYFRRRFDSQPVGVILINYLRSIGISRRQYDRLFLSVYPSP